MVRALAWLFIVRVPADYLAEDASVRGPFRSRHPIIGGIAWFVRNAFGVLFVISGFIMLFIPGQGVLFMFLGLTMVDFPRKTDLIRRMLGRPKLLKVINRSRNRAGKADLEMPELPKSHAEE